MEQHYKTKNGVDIFTYANPYLHSVNLCVYLCFGSMYEPTSYNGIAHFYEHIIFRNLNKIFGGDLYTRLDREAVCFNAYTYNEMIVLDLRFLPHKTDLALEVLANLFSPLQLTSEEIDLERTVIKSEIYEKDTVLPDAWAQQVCWHGTALANPILGTCGSLERIRKKQLEALRPQLFSRGNFFLYLTGKIEDVFLQMVIATLEKQKFLQNVPIRNNFAPVPDGFGVRNGKILVKKASYSGARLNFDMDCAHTTKSERDLLYSVLFSGEASLFYRELNDKTGLVYSYDARQEEYRNIGRLHVGLEYKPEKIKAVYERIVEILQKVKQGDFDLEPFKVQYTECDVLLLDNCSDLNWTMAYENHILDEKTDFWDKRKLYQTITRERISEIASKIFRTNNMVLTAKGHWNAETKADVRALFEKLDD